MVAAAFIFLQIMEIRERELTYLKKTAYISSAAALIWMCAPFLVAAASFGTFVLSDPENNILTPSRTFVSIGLFNILRFPLSFLPGMITYVVQFTVSNKRVREYLAADELDPSIVDRSTSRGQYSHKRHRQQRMAEHF